MLNTHGLRVVYNIPTTFRNMKKLTHLYIAAFLALTLGLMLSCAKSDDSPFSSDGLYKPVVFDFLVLRNR